MLAWFGRVCLALLSPHLRAKGKSGVNTGFLKKVVCLCVCVCACVRACVRVCVVCVCACVRACGVQGLQKVLVNKGVIMPQTKVTWTGINKER